MIENIDWFVRFFTYSSIQVKFKATFIAIFLFFIIRKIIMRVVRGQTTDALIIYRWEKTSTYVVFVVGFIVIGRIWFEGIQSIATYLGLLSAGIAIALKDPLTNVTGWLFILSRSPFVIGDRIQIGQHSGDVIDINFFKFTLMEVGRWGQGEQSSGRILHIPNGKIFIETLANYSKGFKYIWNEIEVLVTFESDWKKTKEILENVSKTHTAHISKAAKRTFKDITKLFLVYQPNFDPQVYTDVKDSGVMLTIRYLCNPRKRRETAQLIWEDILDKFSENKKIDFAYPTTRFYDDKTEGKINK